MGLNTVLTYLKGQLDQLPMPFDLEPLNAFVSPPPFGADLLTPGVYLWGSNGDESRATVPRAQHLTLSSGGHKHLEHRPSCWVAWAWENDDDNADMMFPGICDAIMACLRNLALLDATQHAQDPITGQLSNLLDVGERMSWDWPPVRSLEETRYRRYDFQLTLNLIEVIQA